MKFWEVIAWVIYRQRVTKLEVFHNAQIHLQELWKELSLNYVSWVRRAALLRVFKALG